MPGTDVLDAVTRQHEQLRELFRVAAHARVEDRAGACARLARYLAVHVAAELEALRSVPNGVRGAAGEIDEMCRQAERLEDLGPRCPTFAVQLGLLAAAVDHHVRSGEEAVLGLTGVADDADLERAAATLGTVDDVVADLGVAGAVPAAATFAGQLRAARRVLAGAALAAPGASGRPGRR